MPVLHQEKFPFQLNLSVQKKMSSSGKISGFVFLLFLISCTDLPRDEKRPREWTFIKEIPLGGASPIGMAAQDNSLWISDVDNNRIIKIDSNGKLLEVQTGFERPMHIAVQADRIYIPEYTSDTLRIWEHGKLSAFPLLEQTDAIGGVSIEGKAIAVADFYNHRIILQQGKKVQIIGKQGHNDGELYYPTDLQIRNKLIYVADAYNNRVQVFDFQGEYVRMIGWNEGIDVATGLKVTESQVIIADFEGNRVLLYDHYGKLLQIISGKFNQPTDIEVIGARMYVCNYSGHTISLFKRVNY
jgi:NHL repeat